MRYEYAATTIGTSPPQWRQVGCGRAARTRASCCCATSSVTSPQSALRGRECARNISNCPFDYFPRGNNFVPQVRKTLFRGAPDVAGSRIFLRLIPIPAGEASLALRFGHVELLSRWEHDGTNSPDMGRLTNRSASPSPANL